MREEIIRIIKDNLESIYCHNCAHKDDVDFDICDNCHRKHMCWEIGDSCAEGIADDIMEMIEK